MGAIMASKEISVKKYVVRLSGEEREQLETLIRKGKSPARRLLKARILLKADVSEGGAGWRDSRIIRALETSPSMVCLLKTPKGRERLEIFAPPPYRRGHDHDSFHRRFHTGLPASSPRLLGTRAHRAATSGECPAAAAPRSDLALLHGPTSLGLALPGLAAGPQRDGVGKAGNRGPVASQRLSDILAVAIKPSGAAQDEYRNP